MKMIKNFASENFSAQLTREILSKNKIWGIFLFFEFFQFTAMTFSKILSV
jgi:hypothetical protein